MILGGPVAQAVDDKFPHRRIVAVHRVSAARVVREISLLIEDIPSLVVDAPERKNRSVCAAFRRMVEDDIEHDLDALPVECPHHFLHFGDLHALGSGRRVTRLRSEKTHRAVAPVVAQRFAVRRIRAEIFRLVEFKDRHEFHAINAEAREVFHFFGQARKCARIFDLGSLMAREAAQVHFVNDEVARRHMGNAIRLQQSSIRRHPRAEDRLAGGFRLGHPLLSSHDLARIGVEQDFRRVEIMSIPRAGGSLHAKAVFEIFKFQIVHDHRPHMAQPVVLGECEFRHRLFLAGLEENQRASGRIGAEDRKIHTAGNMTHAEGQ